MKKIIALLLVVAMMIPFVGCQKADETEEATQTPQTTGSETASTESKKTETDPLESFETPVKPGTYRLKHVKSGTVVKSDRRGNLDSEGIYDYVSVEWVSNSNEQFYRISLFGIEQKKHNDTKVIYDNVEVVKSLGVKKINPGDPIISKESGLTSNNDAIWRLVKNDDGTFTIIPRLKKSTCLSWKDGSFILASLEEAGTTGEGKFVFEKVSNEENVLFKEFVSEKGNVVVRLPIDVYEAKNYDSYSVEGKFPKKFVPTEETLQAYADRTQYVYDTYVDLTAFRPYNIIFVHAYNYQGVMAGVVGNNNNVYVNCGPGEWFYSDLSKMQYRSEIMGRDDYNFMVLHEMGHMFDWNRGWTFESECQADLKAAYLVTHTENGYAAPAEYPQNKCFHDDIGSAGFKGLSGGKMSYNPNTPDKSGYSIYRFAEILVEYFQSEEVGWDALYKTFHWYQSKEAKNVPSGDQTWARFELFLAKLSEFSDKPGVDIEASLYENNPREMEVMEIAFKKPAETPETEEK